MYVYRNKNFFKSPTLRLQQTIIPDGNFNITKIQILKNKYEYCTLVMSSPRQIVRCTSANGEYWVLLGVARLVPIQYIDFSNHINIYSTDKSYKFSCTVFCAIWYFKTHYNLTLLCASTCRKMPRNAYSYLSIHRIQPSQSILAHETLKKKTTGLTCPQ